MDRREFAIKVASPAIFTIALFVAWEVACRYNHLDLNDGPILGGKTDAFEVGLNWHLNNNFRIMCEYLHQFRFDKHTAPGGILGGDVDGLGIRTQLAF